MNSIKQLKSVEMIYILPAPAKTLGMPARPSGKSANKTLKDAKTIYKQPSPANPNVGKLIYISVIYVFTDFIYHFYICREPGYAVELI